MAITDIFSRRYTNTVFKKNWSRADSTFMVQAMSMMRNLLWSDADYDKVTDATDQTYRTIHDKVALELGVEHLSQPCYQVGASTYRHKYPQIAKTYLLTDPQDSQDIDLFFKDRISLIEQAFRHKYDTVQSSNSALASEIKKAEVRDMTRGSPFISKAPPPPSRRFDRATSADASVAKAVQRLDANMRKEASTFFRDLTRTTNEALNVKLDSAVDELNGRLRIAGYPLHFHNGLFQMRGDELIEDEVHEWFWELVAEPKWKSVDEQMKEAFDRRDNGDRTAPFHAVSALESVIKIISSSKNANTGSEKGAANYIDNLISERSGRYIAAWEGEVLKAMFRDVRNPFGHGPGESDLPKLTEEQTDWAIDTSMVWCKSLIERL